MRVRVFKFAFVAAHWQASGRRNRNGNGPISEAHNPAIMMKSRDPLMSGLFLSSKNARSVSWTQSRPPVAAAARPTDARLRNLDSEPAWGGMQAGSVWGDKAGSATKLQWGGGAAAGVAVQAHHQSLQNVDKPCLLLPFEATPCC